jgi:hypothetical protein
VVGAEERSRIGAGAAIRVVAARNRETPNASHANGINKTQFCQFVYGKAQAFFSVNRLSDARALARLSSVCLIGRAMVWKSRTN